MDDLSPVTPKFVTLARSLVERWEKGDGHFDSFDTDMAEFVSQAESLTDNPVTLARMVAAWSTISPNG